MSVYILSNAFSISYYIFSMYPATQLRFGLSAMVPTVDDEICIPQGPPSDVFGDDLLEETLSTEIVCTNDCVDLMNESLTSEFGPYKHCPMHLPFDNYKNVPGIIAVKILPPMNQRFLCLSVSVIVDGEYVWEIC